MNKNWKQLQQEEDLKLEIESRIREIKEYKSSTNLDVDKLSLLEMNLIDTINQANKLGITYNLEEM